MRGHQALSFITSLLLGSLILQGCGFHLRGAYNLPEALRRVQISPHQPYDPLQRALRQMLVSNGAHMIEGSDSTDPIPSTLSIQEQTMEERPIAYGIDGQITRARLELKIRYAVDAQPGHHHHENQVRVAREFSLDPQNVLGTDNTRERLKEDLYEEAAAQWVLQLSLEPPA